MSGVTWGVPRVLSAARLGESGRRARVEPSAAGPPARGLVLAPGAPLARVALGLGLVLALGRAVLALGLVLALGRLLLRGLPRRRAGGRGRRGRGRRRCGGRRRRRRNARRRRAGTLVSGRARS